jgi:hypothetical protein
MDQPDRQSHPDGDADFEHADVGAFRASCAGCGGLLKPDVVFFERTCRANGLPPFTMRCAWPIRCSSSARR